MRQNRKHTYKEQVDDTGNSKPFGLKKNAGKMRVWWGREIHTQLAR